MYAVAHFRSEGVESMPMVPRAAVQQVGDRAVVYLVDSAKPGTFVEREVRMGGAAGDSVVVVSGVQVGDVVVSEGSFSVRAERERLGLRVSSATSLTGPAAQQHAAMQGAGHVQEATIAVGDRSFEPSRLALRAEVPVRLMFIRTNTSTCATSVVFPSLKITRELPLNRAVPVEFTSSQAGEVAFACGMNMLRGTVVAR
jgi:hypothetical protein